MVGLVLCSHATFAQGLKEAGIMLAGPQEKFEAISFLGDEELLDLGERIKEASKNYTDGCIYLCDIVNGTPFNGCALAIAETDNVIIAGMSLPMVLEILILRNNDLSINELLASMKQSSSDYIQVRKSEDIFG